MEKYWEAVAAKQKAILTEKSFDALEDGYISVDIHYSSLNYKDALALWGKPGVIRCFPLTCGIDLAGIVTESQHKDYKRGDAVFANGFGLGEHFNGGLSTKQHILGEQALKLPKNLSLKNVMQAGTAGYTAALCLMDLQNIGITPQNGPLYVSGASGGVGMFSIALAAAYGFEVVAISRKADIADFLKKLGAQKIISSDVLQENKRPLDKSYIGSAIDTTGGDILATLLSRLHNEGAIAACGLAQNAVLNTSVLPFILRGAKLLGINSVYQPHEKRIKAWQMLEKLDFTQFDDYFSEIPLAQAQDAAEKILAGEHKGRYVVNMKL